MRTEASSPTDDQRENEGAARLPPERRGETQCLVCLKWFAAIGSVRTHCRRFHEGQGFDQRENAGGPRRMLLTTCFFRPSRTPRADSSATANADSQGTAWSTMDSGRTQ
ncbi:hypothetical protein DQ04_15541010 [Trypanosoma grayi]|uniref:hypothetical protein n=1 Tax=Trypanosoma grayi TaxID=71804 RepID=UPI0004F4BAF4|nr:hypothetical protein DQ04_15541010 [Trypanosoma grayi]KEG06167.1 hypothetical protein DQ04_15541010 [Trypanosoma grayi]